MVAPRRGEVWWGEIEDAKPRPFLVLSRDQAIPVLSRLLAAPVTRTIRGIPSELPLGIEEGLPVACVASFDNVTTIPKAVLVRPMGALRSERISEACAALRAATDC